MKAYPEVRIETVHEDGRAVTAVDTRIFLNGQKLETVRDYQISQAIDGAQLITLAFYAHVAIVHEVRR